MLLELSVLPKGKSPHVSEAAADLEKIIDASGLCHQTKKKGTVLEGSWEQLMAVAKKCHDEVMKTNRTICDRHARGGWSRRGYPVRTRLPIAPP